MRVVYIGPQVAYLLNGKQYEVAFNAKTLNGCEVYGIRDESGETIPYPADQFLKIEESRPLKPEEENLPLLELISRTRRNLDRIEIIVRKESR